MHASSTKQHNIAVIAIESLVYSISNSIRSSCVPVSDYLAACEHGWFGASAKVAVAGVQRLHRCCVRWVGKLRSSNSISAIL